MKTIRSTIRFLALLIATFSVYGAWYVLRFFVPNKIYLRQLTFTTWARAFVWIAGTSVEVIGNAPKPPFFLVSNHVGYFDIPVIRSAVTGVFVAKHEIKGWTAIGKMVTNMGSIYVDRERRRDIPRAGAEIIERLSSGEGVIVFPEGTSTKGEGVQPFNSSFLAFASKTDVPVSYVSLFYRTPAGDLTPSESICWWDDTPFLQHVLRMLSVPKKTAVLRFGDEPIVDTDRKQLAARLHSAVEAGFEPMD